jgi:DNA polymerase-3 subunit gamma/tau
LGKYKVFIIDEVHMLSTAAFNAFLKTLEEPPAHVIFILATTEKHKILPTILSRCQIYDFERMTVQNTIAHLKSVAEKEGIQYEEEALAVIAEKADGGMRDALSIFDQAASFCQGNITYQKVIEDLNVLDSEYYFRIVDYALANKVTDIIVLLNDVINKGFDGGLLIQGLAKHVRNVMMAKDAQTLKLLEVSEQARERYQQQAQNAPLPFLYSALRIMNQCDINYRQSSNKRLLVELTLIEVAQITQPDEGVGSGRKPRRLKSLFKNLIQQTQPKTKTAQQVAAAEVPNRVAKQVEAPAAQPTAARPAIKASSIGMSWSNLRQQATQKMQILPGTQGIDNKVSQESAEFTQENLELQWMAMCNRMPQKYSGIAARMKNMNPVVTQLPDIELVVPNEIIKTEVENIRGSILSTLKLYLHNSNITFTLRVAEKHEQARILTRREQFEEMQRANPSIEKLKAAFDLEFA